MRGVDDRGWSPTLDQLNWVTKYSVPDGIPFRVLEDTLAEVPTAYLDCVAYIYPDREAEKSGDSGGTAFIVDAPLDVEGWYQSYIVTAAHILGSDEVGNDPVVRVNLTEGKSIPIPTEASSWKIDQINDIAVYPIDLDRDKIRHIAVPLGRFLTKDHIEQYKFGPGNDVFVIGKLARHEGATRNLPSVRFGSISMMPGEPFKRAGKDDIPEVFFVEFRSIGGYSGSPAFLCEPPFHLMDKAKLYHKWSLLPHLLGLDLGHIKTLEPLLEKKVERGKARYAEVPGKFYETNTAMATIVPAWQIAALLDREDVVMRRQKDAEEIRQRTAGSDDLALDSARAVEPEFTQQDFEADLRKVTRRVKPSESGEGTK